MIVHLNISKDKELRNAILTGVRSILKSEIRDTLKPLIKEVVEEKYSSMLQTMNEDINNVNSKIKKFKKQLYDLMNQADNTFIRSVSDRTARIVESRICQTTNFIDDVKTGVIKNLTQALENNLKN